MKKCLFLSVLVASILALAVNVSASGSFFEVDETPSQFQEHRSVRDDIMEFFADKGYTEGINSRDSGGDIFIAVGIGTIQAPRNSNAYMRSRINAFDKAMLAAKKQMVEYIGIDIQNTVVNDYAEGESPAYRRKREADASAALETPDLLEKTRMLVSAKLDQLLREEGVDLTKPVPPETVKKAVTSDVFEKFTRSVGTTRVVGMQPWKVFEESPDGAKGQIGVVAVYSEKLHKMADALYRGQYASLPQGTPRKPVAKQIPKDERVLLTTFGVQQRTDENGQLVLVAFGQGVPRTQSTRSVDAAYDKAKLDAMSQLRSFAGEIAAVESEAYQYENVNEFEGGMEQFENEEYFRDKVQTKAGALKIAGIQKIHRWKAVHPLTNQPVVGVVIAWSPSGARHASQLASQMSATPQAARVHSKSPKGNYRTGSDQSGAYSNSGASADEDSF